VSETYYAGGYWGIREEPPDSCARRLEDFLLGLSRVDSSFEHWYETAKSLKESLKRPLRPVREELVRFVQKNKDPAFDDLGVSLGGWNGAPNDHEDCAFLVRCGGHHARANNRCVFSLPSRGSSAGRVLTASVLTDMLRATASAWEPDWGVAMSHSHRDLVESRRVPKAPYIGWVTYLARHRGTVPPLPSPVRVEPVEDKGTLIVLTPERFTADNPEHVALAETVRELLDQAGLLKPLMS